MKLFPRNPIALKRYLEPIRKIVADVVALLEPKLLPEIESPGKNARTITRIVGWVLQQGRTMQLIARRAPKHHKWRLMAKQG